MSKKVYLALFILMFVSLACSTTFLNTTSVENFEYEDSNWSEPVIVTSSDPDEISVTLEDDTLEFDIRAVNSYVYRFYEGGEYRDVVLEAEFQNSGMPQAVAFICHASEDYRSWYEFRVSSTGQYEMLSFDMEIKDRGGMPYQSVVKSDFTEVIYPQGRYNDVRVTCEDNEMILEVNGEELINKSSSEFPEKGSLGIGVLAFDQVPVIINVGQVTISKP